MGEPKKRWQTITGKPWLKKNESPAAMAAFLGCQLMSFTESGKVGGLTKIESSPTDIPHDDNVILMTIKNLEKANENGETPDNQSEKSNTNYIINLKDAKRLCAGLIFHLSKQGDNMAKSLYNVLEEHAKEQNDSDS